MSTDHAPSAGQVDRLVRLPSCDGVEITAITKLKHADLWRAAVKMGSQSGLAVHLGVRANELGEWINLKRCPPAEPIGERWTEDFITQIEAKLAVLTGKSWDELWPPALRNNAEFLDCEKTIEQTRYVADYAMHQYAVATQERYERMQLVMDEEPAGHDERSEAIEAALATLTSNEREIVKLRFGIGYESHHTLEETGRIMRLTRERVRMIECKALRKLGESRRCSGLLSHFGGTDAAASSVE